MGQWGRRECAAQRFRIPELRPNGHTQSQDIDVTNALWPSVSIGVKGRRWAKLHWLFLPALKFDVSVTQGNWFSPYIAMLGRSWSVFWVPNYCALIAGPLLSASALWRIQNMFLGIFNCGWRHCMENSRVCPRRIEMSQCLEVCFSDDAFCCQ